TWNKAPAQKSSRVKAIYHDAGTTSDTQRRHLDIALDPDSPTETDLVVVDLPDLPRFIEQKRLRALDRQDTTGFLDTAAKACGYKGRQWALPLNADAPVLAYNVNLLTKGLHMTEQALHDRYEKPNKSIYDLISEDGATALAAMQPTHPQLKAVYAGQFGDYEGFTVNILEQLAAADANVEKDRYLTEQLSQDAVRTVSKRLMSPHFLPDGSFASPGTVNEGYDEEKAQAALLDGTVLFARLWPSNYKALTDSLDETKTADFAAVALPHGVLGGQAIAIAEKSRHPKEARALLNFLTGEMSQLQLLLEGGYIPTREVIYGDPIGERSLSVISLSSISKATPRPSLKYYDKYSEQLRKEIRAALDNGYQLSPDTPEHLKTASKTGKLP
ncbi:MAG: multiple sugar transport system substrate-binding protein, partial [Actinomycetota bacterium]|nr:multiple sugar transport system substrate-binding protein [Actinomycetota bacterium]